VASVRENVVALKEEWQNAV